MIDAIRLDRLTAGAWASLGEWPVGEYARIHPDRMIPDPAAAPAADPADPTSMAMSGAPSSGLAL